MNHTAIVKQFLKDRTTANGVTMGYPFVTISRQAGAGGHMLARQIIRALEKKYTYEAASDWEVFDQMLCALIAQQDDIKATFESLVAEEYQSEIHQFIGDLVSGQPSQYKLYKRIFEVVRLLTSIGRVVLVGRGGAFIAHDLPYGVHIRLVSGEKIRIKRMAKMLEVDEASARRTMITQDRARARMARDNFGVDVADPIHYHAVFNAERMSIPDIADCVVEMVGTHIEAMRGKKK